MSLPWNKIDYYNLKKSINVYDYEYMNMPRKMRIFNMCKTLKQTYFLNEKQLKHTNVGLSQHNFQSS